MVQAQVRRALGIAIAALLALPAGASAQELQRVWGTIGEGPGQFTRVMDTAVSGPYLYTVENFPDSSGRVQKFTLDGKLIRTFGQAADDDLRRQSGERENLLYYPDSIAVGPDGNVYVGEDGSDRSRISVWSPLGKYLRSFGTEGQGLGQFGSIGGLTLDSAGSTLVADDSNQRITVFDANGNGAGSLAGGDSVVAVDEPYLGGAADITFGPDNTLWVADNPQIKVFQANGAFVGILGDRCDEPGACFQRISSLAFAGSVLYVADENLNRVQAFDMATGTYLGLVGRTPGSQPGQFNEPRGLSTDCNGSLYVADFQNSRIQRFGAPGAGGCGDPEKDERFLVTLAGKSPQKFRANFAVRVQVGCDRPCAARLSGRIKAGARSIKLASRKVGVSGQDAVSFNVAPSEKGTDQTLSALKRGRKVTASVKLAVTDLTGRKVSRSKTYRLR